MSRDKQDLQLGNLNYFQEILRNKYEGICQAATKVNFLAKHFHKKEISSYSFFPKLRVSAINEINLLNVHFDVVNFIDFIFFFFRSYFEAFKRYLSFFTLPNLWEARESVMIRN